MTVWNRSPGKAGELVSAGASEAPGIADTAVGADVVMIMLGNDAVRSVALGALRSSVGGRTAYVDCSTASPNLSADLAEAFAGRFLALPVVGSLAAVSTGTAVLPIPAWWTACVRSLRRCRTPSGDSVVGAGRGRHPLG